MKPRMIYKSLNLKCPSLHSVFLQPHIRVSLRLSISLWSSSPTTKLVHIPGCLWLSFRPRSRHVWLARQLMIYSTKVSHIFVLIAPPRIQALTSNFLSAGASTPFVSTSRTTPVAQSFSQPCKLHVANLSLAPSSRIHIQSLQKNVRLAATIFSWSLSYSTHLSSEESTLGISYTATISVGIPDVIGASGSWTAPASFTNSESRRCALSIIPDHVNNPTHRPPVSRPKSRMRCSRLSR